MVMVEARKPTEKQMRVIELVAEGYQNLEIANQLFLAEHTVANHVTDAMRRTNTKTRAQLAVLCVRQGWMK